MLFGVLCSELYKKKKENVQDCTGEVNMCILAGSGCAWRSLEQVQDLLDDPENLGNLGVCYNVYLQGMAQ